MSMLNFPKYKFVISYDKKTENLLGVLIQTYEPIFLKYIADRKSLTKKEEVILNDGINDIKKYIVVGLVYNMAFGTSKKTPLELECMYYMNVAKKFYSKSHFQDLLESESVLLAEDAIYEALGVVAGKEHKAFNKLTERANIVSYASGIFFYKFLTFLQSHIGACNRMFLDGAEDEIMTNIKEENRILLDGLLERSLLKKSVPLGVLNNIRESMLSGDIEEEILPYVQFLANFKEEEDRRCNPS